MNMEISVMILIYSLWILPLDNELDLQRFVLKFWPECYEKAGLLCVKKYVSEFMYNVKIVV